ncbi:MAG: membrane protein insertase YidC [Bacteroidales bacterium]|nr:membrane protein insertase YidC [Bacteroidales bacterium]
MDKNQVMGFVLIGLILVGFYFFTKPNEENVITNQQDSLIFQQDSISHYVDDTTNINIDTNQFVTTDSTSDSLVQVQLLKQFDVFANSAIGDQKYFVVENNNMILTFTNQGARLYSVEIKGYKEHNGNNLVVFEGDYNRFNINFFTQNNILIKTENLVFSTDNEVITRVAGNPESISFKAKIFNDKYLEFVYTIQPEGYLIDFDINFVNLDDVVAFNTTYLEVFWEEYVKHLERGEKWERQNTQLYYKSLNESVKKVSNRKDKTQDDISTKISWVSYKQQFFNATLISEEGFDNVVFKTQALPDDTTNMFLMQTSMSVPYYQGDQNSVNLAFYVGPNQYNVLKSITINDQRMMLEQLVPLGGKFLGIINKGLIIPLFNFLGKFIKNYGLIIFVLTLIIKLVLFPLTYRSYASAAKMRILKPEIEKATEKIPKDKQMDRQQATMALYKKAGVNPMGGCLPTLLQMPILIALYRFFPASIELRQKSFLWVKDLSTYDAIVTWEGTIPIVNWIFGNHISLFTLLMAVAMVFNTMLTSANQSMDDSNPQAKTMKYMMYLMPVMMIVWFNGFSAGLSYYYFLSTLIGIIQIFVIRKFIDEEKVLSQLRENMKNNKTPKKSKFQQRLEDMQKQQSSRGNQPRKK